MTSQRNRIDINNASKELLDELTEVLDPIDRKGVVELALRYFKHKGMLADSNAELPDLEDMLLLGLVNGKSAQEILFDDYLK